MPTSVPDFGGGVSQVCQPLAGSAYHMQPREALWLPSVGIDRPGLGNYPLSELRFKTAVPAGPFDLQSKCNLREILNSLLSLQQEAGL